MLRAAAEAKPLTLKEQFEIWERQKFQPDRMLMHEDTWNQLLADQEEIEKEDPWDG